MHKTPSVDLLSAAQKAAINAFSLAKSAEDKGSTNGHQSRVNDLVQVTPEAHYIP